MAKRTTRMEAWLSHGSKQLPKLSVGDTVAVQDLRSNGKAGRWNNTGTVVEIGQFGQYTVLIDGARRPSQEPQDPPADPARHPRDPPAS